MKNLLLVLLLSPFALSAQRSMQQYYWLNMLNFDEGYTFYDEQSAPLKMRKQLKISEIQSVYTSRKGKKSEYRMTYNKIGKVLHTSSSKNTIDYTYQNDSLLTKTVSKRKGKIYETNSTFSNGKLATKEVLKNNKTESVTLVTYNANNKITSSKLIKGRKTYAIEYTFNDEDKMAKSVYSINGKKKKEWIYECKPEGQIVASKTEAMSSFCTYREESADGSYTTFTRSLQEGKPYLSKQTFNKDSVMIMSQRYLNDTTLIWESRKENNVETILGFNKSGKRRYKQIMVTNEAGSVISREYFLKTDQKTRTRLVFELNADGTTKKREFYWKGKLQGTTTYNYKFF